MTMRERMLAVVQGREHDRVPFAMYEIMFPPQQAFDLLGHGRIGIIRYRPIYRIEHPHCRFDSEIFLDGGTKWQRNVLHTPGGIYGAEDFRTRLRQLDRPQALRRNPAGLRDTLALSGGLHGPRQLRAILPGLRGSG